MCSETGTVHIFAMAKEKRKRKELSSFSILFIIIFVLGIVTKLLNGQAFSPHELADGTIADHVIGANLSDVFMSPSMVLKRQLKFVCLFLF